MLRSLFELARPKDWIKNVFVLMPLPFAVAGGAVFPLRPLALGLLGFCLINSAVYAWNDVLDAELDQRHPRKRSRPVAAGRLSATQARAFAGALLAGGAVLLAASAVPAALLLAAIYVVLNAVYAHGAKHVALVDVFLLASGYVIRVLLGCALVGVAPSNWLLLCSSTLALFLSLTKRRADLTGGSGAEHRPSLSGYSVAFLDQSMGLSAGIALVSYALYSIEAAVFVPGREFVSLPFVAFGLLDTLRKAQVEGAGGSPVELVTRDPMLLACGAGWALAALWSLGLL